MALWRQASERLPRLCEHNRRQTGEMETGFDVVEARDGLEAIDKARESHPDIIVTDLAKPRLDGIGGAFMPSSPPSLSRPGCRI